MRQIKKILFPVDFSESSVGAARHVEALAGRFEAEIMLLHAVGMGENTPAEERTQARKAQLDSVLGRAPRMQPEYFGIGGLARWRVSGRAGDCPCNGCRGRGLALEG